MTRTPSCDALAMSVMCPVTDATDMCALPGAWASAVKLAVFFFFFFEGDRERERGREKESQAGSVLSAQNPTRGSISQTVRS